MRTCRTCRVEKLDSDFYPSDRSSCKACHKEQALRFKLAHPEKQAEYSRRYIERNPERWQQVQRDWRERNVEQETARKLAWRARNHKAYSFLQKASAAVRRAIERGELVEPAACEQCARDDRRITAAHLDYLPPYLNIRWLCYSCHTTMDRWAA